MIGTSPQLWPQSRSINIVSVEIGPVWIPDQLRPKTNPQKAAAVRKIGKPLTKPLWKPKIKKRLLNSCNGVNRKNNPDTRNLLKPIIPTTWGNHQDFCDQKLSGFWMELFVVQDLVHRELRMRGEEKFRISKLGFLTLPRYKLLAKKRNFDRKSILMMTL